MEEFTTARWFYYEGVEQAPRKKHFAEKRIDYGAVGYSSITSLSKAKILASFRICHSIFDKMAFFLNEYLELGISDKNEINLRTLWCVNFPQNKQLRDSMKQYLDNLHLKALYWLSKDVYYRESDEEMVEPATRDWNKIRNHLTHQYLRVFPTILDEFEEAGSYSLSYQELQDRCLRMLQLRPGRLRLSLSCGYI